MKRSLSLTAALGTAALTIAAAAPAFAEDYYYDGGADAAGGAIVCGVWACVMIPLVLLGVFNLWMLIDAIMRQEHEYPNSSGNSKLIWILLLLFVGLIAAIVYYFAVFKKIKRGTVGQTPSAAPMGGYQPPAAPQSFAPPAAPVAPQAPAAPPAPPQAPAAPPAPPAAPATPAPPAPPAPPAAPEE
ncbi:MAG: PLD nuclease N-terminal domain-containing protein [Coriobacteriia bacterium]|nr:PLD nuclease N-terminal domain-containing protein [Coriobacteriia bacterium]